jgi:epsilon-lactone hydrolase
MQRCNPVNDGGRGILPGALPTGAMESTPVKRLRDLIGRNMLFPALRLMRAQMRLISDPVKLRTVAAQVDALGRLPRDVRTTAVVAGGAPATWIDVAEARPDHVVLYLHGGAFVAETPTFHGGLLARIGREARARALMLSYRLAPEHPFPAALDDCVGAYRWLLAQGQSPGRIVVAGDSAGGNLTLALLLRLRDEGLPLPAGAVALSPVTDFTFSGDSVQRNDGIDDMFSADMMEPLVDVYLADRALRSDPLVSPVFGDFTGLPPLLLVVGSTELLLDDSVRVAQRWPDATLLVWHGMPHVFPGFDVLPEAREATQRIGRFIADRMSVDVETPITVEAAPVAAARPDPTPLPHVPRAMSAAERLYLAAAVLAGVGWLVVVWLAVVPLLWRVNPLVWIAAPALALVWVGAVYLFLRSSWRRRRR